MKLARTITLVLLSTFVALLTVLQAFEIRRALADYEHDAAVELALTGRALRPAISEVWEQEGPARALELLRRADLDVEHVEIHWIPRGAAAPPVDADVTAALANGREATRARPASAPDRLFVYVPTTAGGAIELSRHLADRHAVLAHVLRDRLRSVLAAVAGAAVISVLAGVWLVGRPVARLVDQARRIGSGDLGHRVPPRRRDEIGELAREMNGMCDRLRAARDGMADAAEARIRALEQLRHADRLRTVGTLASGMAHELGTPLSIIAGRAKMIAAAAPGGELAQFAGIILGQTEKMTRIMRNLLDFARRRPAQKQPTDLRDVVRRTVDLLTPLARRKGVELRVEASEAPWIANIDAAQIEQALANLVVNAIQAMPAGGDVTISTLDASARRAANDGAFRGVAVRDRGEGIRPEDQPHVFEPFFTTKDVGEGTGLGLSVTYGIVEEHGGFLDLESAPGAGSCFSMFFPAPEEAA
ncbi:MAG TPA: ATP-binding protein [Minicystis sp.]|nr:ATP-binding protein [Minicystis sp.]